MKYSTLRKGLYDALAAPMIDSGTAITPEIQKNLKTIANHQADSIIEFITQQTFTIKEFKGAVELVEFKNNPVLADIKQNTFFDVIDIIVTICKDLIAPFKLVPVTAPLHTQITVVLNSILAKKPQYVAADTGEEDVIVPVDLGKNTTKLNATGYAYVGSKAAGIGVDGQTLADEFGNHTKVVLHKEKIKATEFKKLR